MIIIIIITNTFSTGCETKLNTVDPEIKTIILLMQKMLVSVIHINNMAHLFLTMF